MTTFNLAAYIPLALRTEAPLPTPFDRLNHALLGLITETGEFVTEIKRIAIYGKSMDSLAKDGKSTLAQHIAEEIGDTLWYIAIAVDALQIQFLGGAHQPQLTGKATHAELIAGAGGFAISIGSFAQVLASGADRWTDHAPLLESAIGDILHDLNILASTIGIPLQQIADENIAKLALRYPDKFDAVAAEARADKGGLDARNS